MGPPTSKIRTAVTRRLFPSPWQPLDAVRQAMRVAVTKASTDAPITGRHYRPLATVAQPAAMDWVAVHWPCVPGRQSVYLTMRLATAVRAAPVASAAAAVAGATFDFGEDTHSAEYPAVTRRSASPWRFKSFPLHQAPFLDDVISGRFAVSGIDKILAAASVEGGRK